MAEVTSTRRDYVVGLPVCVSIDDGGFVAVNVDLSEMPVAIRKDSFSGPLGEEWEGIDGYETAVADSEVLERWIRTHSVSNGDFVEEESAEPRPTAATEWTHPSDLAGATGPDVFEEVPDAAEQPPTP